MLAFNNQTAIKQKYVSRALLHQQNGDYMQDYGYWKNGKGSALGCLAEDATQPASILLEEANLPEALTYLMEQLFEKLPHEEYQRWAHRFISGIEVGTELAHVANRFVVWILSQEIAKRFEVSDYPEITGLGIQLTALYLRQIKGPACPDREWTDMMNQASRVASNINYAAAYSESPEALAATRAAYTLNYAARLPLLPQSGAYIITCAGNCGVDYKVMADQLIAILKGADGLKTQSNPKDKETRFSA